jgi:hypothetical protein
MNQTSPSPDPSSRSNPAEIEAWTKVPVVGVLPFLTEPGKQSLDRAFEKFLNLDLLLSRLPDF